MLFGFILLLDTGADIFVDIDDCEFAMGPEVDFFAKDVSISRSAANISSLGSEFPLSAA
jgi:hypothetical protein